MNKFKLKISSPNGDVYDGEAVMLTLRGVAGDLAILAGHIPFVTSVVACEVKVEIDDDTEKFGVIDGGLLTVGQNEVTLLSGSFKWK